MCKKREGRIKQIEPDTLPFVFSFPRRCTRHQHWCRVSSLSQACGHLVSVSTTLRTPSPPLAHLCQQSKRFRGAGWLCLRSEFGAAPAMVLTAMSVRPPWPRLQTAEMSHIVGKQLIDRDILSKDGIGRQRSQLIEQLTVAYAED